MTRTIRLVGIAGLFLLSLGCGAKASVKPISPQAQAITVRKADPPPGYVEIGPVEGKHGSGCGMYGRAGTFEGALNALKVNALQMGAQYVELMTATEPHSESGCFDQEFTLRGVAYRKGSASEAPAETADADKEEKSEPPKSPAGGCDPPCSPGYSCSAGTCIAVCNPQCADGQVCRQDRTCGPAEKAEGTDPPSG